MREKTTRIGLLFGILLWGITIGIHSQDAAKVSLVNAGKMYVSSSGAANNIYVLGSVRMVDGVIPVNIVQQGVTKLTGHFYQDCAGNVFNTDASGIGTSTGTITFTGEAFDKEITTTSLPAFNRSDNYIAFPNVQIDMNKNLILPSRMAADMDKLEVSNGKTGKLWLKSTNDGSDEIGRIYDASLRFPKRSGDADNTGTQSAKAPAGKIVVERAIDGYRGDTRGQGVIFPFATPFFETQRSGYFAGNWVHRPVRDASHHTQYVYGDKAIPGTDLISRDQFVTDPLEKLAAGQAYLIKPLGLTEFPDLVKDYDFALQITGAGAPTVDDYKKTMFVFDGSVYKLPQEDEQLNLMPIFDATVSSVKNKAVRILIGNSYTAPLDLKKISLYLYNHPSLYISRNIQVYVPHQTPGYVPYDILQHIQGKVSAPSLLTNHTIPGMGVFMIILHDGYNSTGNLKIDRSFLTHDNNPHNLRSATGFYDEILFTLKSEYYSQTEDRAAIGFRAGAKETRDDLDMVKSKSDILETGPVLYTLSSDNVNLASNAIPAGTSNVRLCIESNHKESDRCRLHFSRQESLNTECVILEDKFTGRFIDLRDLEYYDFTLYPGEQKDRFVVHFTMPTNINDMNTQALRIFYNNRTQTLEVIGITGKDDKSALIVTDTQGRILKKENLKESHKLDNLTEGTYIAKIIGESCVVLKFSKDK